MLNLRTAPSRNLPGGRDDPGTATGGQRIVSGILPGVQVEVTLLGRFRVVVAGRVIEDEAWRHRRSRDLVKLLALAPEHRLHGEQIIDLLWPDLAVRAGRANLHKAAHFARRALGAREAVVLRHEEVILWPDATVVVDVERFQRCAELALASGEAEGCAAAARAYGGDLLAEDPYAEWARDRRDALRRLHLDLLRRARLWEEVLVADPTDEDAHRAVMRQWLDAGQPEAAARQFRQLVTALTALDVRAQPATVALYELALRAGAVARPIAVRPPLMGREGELRTAKEVLARAASGEGGTLLVEGAPGMGKTRFNLELCDGAAGAGWAVARGGASESAPAPLAPVAGAVHRLVRSRPDVVGLLSERFQSVVTGLTARPPRVRGERPELAPALAQLLTYAAGNGVAVLSIDDVHAADDATIGLLGDLANAVRFEPVVVVLAFRREEAPPVLLGLRRSLMTRGACTRIELQHLDRRSAESLARRAAAHPPTPDSLRAIWRLAEGNPFFTEELAASIQADGSVTVPESLADLVAARLASLPADVHRALARMAIADHPFTAADLAALAGTGPDHAVRLLQQACSCGAVVSDHGRYRLRHALIAGALARSVPIPERLRIHGDVADRLIAAGAPAAQVAHHLAAAGRNEAPEWLHRAGQEALTVAGFAEALHFADRGLDHAAPAVRPALLELRADALHAMGDPAAGAAYGVALAECPPPRIPALRIKRARACLAVGAVDAAQLCLANLDPVRPGEQARLLVLRGLIAWYRDDLEKAEELATRARSLALAEGSQWEATEVLALELMVAHTGGQRRLTSLSQWMEAYAAPSLAGMAMDPHLCVADYLLASDEPADAVIAFGRRVRSATERCDAVRGQAFAALVLAEAEMASGELRGAERDFGDAIALHRRVGSVAGEVLGIEGLAELALHRKRTEEVAGLLDEAVAASRWSPMCSHLLIRAHAIRVRASPVANAVETVEDAEAVLAGQRPCPVCSARFLVAATTACARAGSGARAQHYLGLLGALGGPTRRGPLGAAVTAARAEVALARGEPAAALRRFTDAAGWYEQLGHRPQAQSCRRRAELARACVASGREP